MFGKKTILARLTRQFVRAKLQFNSLYKAKIWFLLHFVEKKGGPPAESLQPTDLSFKANTHY